LEKTFGEIVDEALPIITQGFRNPAHIQQCYSTLSASYIPHLRSKKITEIDTADIAKDLAPLWKTKGETAVRLRGRIEKILDYAEGQNLRNGNNPARLSPALKALLGGEPKRIGKHHPAMPYRDVSGFMSRLKERKGAAAAAYRFLIFTAARVNEATGAKWDEINWIDNTWTVPAERYKTNKPHTVPLSQQALELLKSIKQQQEQLGLTTQYIFTNDKGVKISNGAFSALQKRMNDFSFTAHGFRSSFRDYFGDKAKYADYLLEECLGHELKNKVERAYRRGRALEARREIMKDWADYISKT
jgi:integrase